MKHVIMVNPVSGRKKGYKNALIVQKLLKKYNISSEIVSSTYSGQLKAISEEISKKEKTRFYCIGGDGTLNEIVSGIINTDSEIVVLPCGTGNDFSRYINDYNSLRKIILTSLNTQSTKCDVMKLNSNRYCINILNAGFDALVAYNMNKFRWVPFISGTAKYNISILYTLFFNKNYRLRIHTNEFIIKDKFTLVATTNGRYYGGGVIPCINSQVDDGKLNTCSVKSTSLLQKIILLPKYKNCKHQNLPQVKISDNIDFISIVSNKKFPLSIDGEIIFTNKIKANILKNAVNIVRIKKANG
ncbi:MAG: diacylglycerol/lipid kinase family protein [Clostridia bacterium]